jgi:hypothetical protein
VNLTPALYVAFKCLTRPDRAPLIALVNIFVLGSVSEFKMGFNCGPDAGSDGAFNACFEHKYECCESVRSIVDEADDDAAVETVAE